MAAKKSKKHRKHGRNAVSCASYASQGRENINKCKRLARHLFVRPKDVTAKDALFNRDAYWNQARRALNEAGAKYAVVLTDGWWSQNKAAVS